ncbi:MAG TPA: SPOR domain-containing protein [Rhodocyclaceae bacterium]|nr:SPOR domain-containing protein [Rhodocyclaceae bacterium]
MNQHFRQRGGMLLGIFIGLVLGVVISFAVVWTMNKARLPFQDKGMRTDRPTNGNGQESGTPAPLPGKPGDKVGEKAAGEKPRFEFYKILPGSQEAAPAPVQAPTVAKTGDAKAGAGEPLFLQIGAFQQSADADNAKAKLALIGLDASVQEVEIPDRGKMFRVRTGPFPNVEEMNRVRTLLSQNGIQTTSVKGK